MVPGRCPALAGYDMANGMSLLSKIGIFWRNFRRRQRIDHIVHVESMQDVPNKLNVMFYVVGKPGSKWAIMALSVPMRGVHRR
jgi:hypothetical protein